MSNRQMPQGARRKFIYSLRASYVTGEVRYPRRLDSKRLFENCGVSHLG